MTSGRTGEEPLHLNPRIRIKGIVSQTKQNPCLMVQAPVRGEGLRSHLVTEKEDPEVYGLLREMPSQLRHRPSKPFHFLRKSSRAAFLRMQKLGVLLPTNKLPREVVFCCSPEEPEFHKHLPAWASMRGSQNIDHRKLRVNPALQLQTHQVIPEALCLYVGNTDPFATNYPIAWLGDPVFGTHLPYWAPGKYKGLLSRLVPGRSPPSGLDSQCLDWLLLSEILIDPKRWEKELNEKENRLHKAATTFKEGEYAEVGHILPPLQIAAIRSYYQKFLAEGYAKFGDGQVDHRYGVYNERLALFFHYQLTELVQRITGIQLKLSFSYFASYEKEATLPKHHDKKQAEITVSLLVDYFPEPHGPSSWPLCLDVPGKGPRAFSQELGDALIYNGHKLDHFRETLPPGHISRSLLFHYVRKDYSGPMF